MDSGNMTAHDKGKQLAIVAGPAPTTNTAPDLREIAKLASASEPRKFLGRSISLPDALRALRHRNFRLFWSGYMVSLVGMWMQIVARGWLVLELTGSAFWLGMVGFANSVPVLLFSLLGGAVADNAPKRMLIIWTQIVQMVMAFVLAFLTFAGIVEVWHVIAISLVTGTAFAFDAPARQAFTVEMVGKADLMNAVALNSAIFNGARVVGPTIGALVLAWQGAGLAFLLNGLSYFAVLSGLLRMNEEKVERKKDQGKAITRIVEGLRYVVKSETIGPLMFLVVATSIFAFPYATLMPVFASGVLNVGEEGYGMLMAFSGIGALVGAISLTIRSGKADINRGRLILLGAIGLPIFLGIFALSENYLLSLAMLIGIGYTMISINATTNTVIQTTVPDELRGRVSGVFAFLFIGMAPLGNLQAGIIADHFGAPAALASGAVFCLAVAIGLFVFKRDLFKLK
jgi:MFS family permease